MTVEPEYDYADMAFSHEHLNHFKEAEECGGLTDERIRQIMSAEDISTARIMICREIHKAQQALARMLAAKTDFTKTTVAKTES